MCELLAINIKEPIQLNNILNNFFIERSKYHPHGWGLAIAKEENKRIILKEPVTAFKSKFLKRQLNYPIISKDILGHVRYATVGNIENDNCHPFHYEDNSGRSWTLIHNGTIFHSNIIEPFKKEQKGETDSERVLLLLIERINKKISSLERSLSEEERIEVVEELIAELSHRNKLNIMIFDGDILYVHVNTKNLLHYTKINNGYLICSKPIELESEVNWNEIELNRLFAFKNGQLKFEGKKHRNEYIEDPEVNKYLYLQYASL